MGQFSWHTQDTHHRIVNGEDFHVVMTDNKGNQWHEICYDGYGVFGGKDYYELMAEMNGYTLDDFNGDKDALRSKGIDLAFEGDPNGENAPYLYPSLSENGKYYGGVSPEIDRGQGFPDYFDWDDTDGNC